MAATEVSAINAIERGIVFFLGIRGTIWRAGGRAGGLTVWLSGCLVVWLSGCLAVWLSGKTMKAVWLSGKTMKPDNEARLARQ